MKEIHVVFNVVFALVLLMVSPALAVSNEDVAEKKTVSVLSFGDYSSRFLVQKAWASFSEKDFDAAVRYAQKTVELYAASARKMQSALTTYPSGIADDVFKFWALNNVGTALFYLAETYRKAGYKKEADKLFRRVIKEYYYAQCWNRQGWFWKPAEVAQNRLDRKRIRRGEK